MSTERKLLKSETSRVIRVSGAHYEAIQELKNAQARREKKRKITYDGFFDYILPVATALFEGREHYGLDGTLFSDLAEARGESVIRAKRAKQDPVWPDIFVRLGRDLGPS